MGRLHFIIIAALSALGVVNTAFAGEKTYNNGELKAAAENGDAQAQDTLGDVFYSGDLDERQAVIWYRKAATNGIVHAQYRLAHILLGWAKSPVAKKEARAMHADEAIPWLVRAANQDYKLAQVELGQVCEEGKFVTQDLVQAYKWYSLGAVGTRYELAANLGQAYRDRLILRMTKGQITAGDILVAVFVPNPGTNAPMPEPVYVRQIRLTGLSGEPPRRLAMLNGKAVGEGESATLKLDGRSVVIRCVSIDGDAVNIAVEGVPGTKELRLR